ncbi:MAG: hypothetical protein KBC73_20890 [Burkholderiaceae bacterium]|nr:hypothetical protein [Burkholderiaceae bacterium]
MNTKLGQFATVVMVAVALSGCASHSQEAADREQRSADDLRRAGAGSTTAARNAQERADQNRMDAQCSEAVSCLADVAGQLILGILTGGSSSKK